MLSIDDTIKSGVFFYTDTSIPSHGGESCVETPQVSTKTLLPGRSCRQAALRNRLVTEEECGRKTEGSCNITDLLQSWSWYGSLEQVFAF